MTSAIGDAKHPPADLAGFSLIELLLTLALMGLLAGLCIGASASLFGGRSAFGEDIFWDAVNEAHRQAVAANEIVRLTCPGGGGLLRMKSTGMVRDFVLPPKVSFRLGQLGLPGDSMAAPAVTDERLLGISFYPDGTCDAFQGELIDSVAGAHAFAVDPWTCAAAFSRNGK